LVVKKPNGYETLMGPGGVAFSGGERERIALARAVYGNPFFVDLDEPNSNMDAVGERALAQTIRQLREAGSIVIVVTHRATVLNDVNKLLQVSNGWPIVFGDTKTVLARLKERLPAGCRQCGRIACRRVGPPRSTTRSVMSFSSVVFLS
jgi:ABC-type protease/lipase transport system fused ATPase/permease subunit